MTSLHNREERVFKETRLRNLKRKFSKMSNHTDLVDECNDLKYEIDNLKKELNC